MLNYKWQLKDSGSTLLLSLKRRRAEPEWLQSEEMCASSVWVQSKRPVSLEPHVRTTKSPFKTSYTGNMPLFVVFITFLFWWLQKPPTLVVASSLCANRTVPFGCNLFFESRSQTIHASITVTWTLFVTYNKEKVKCFMVPSGCTLTVGRCKSRSTESVEVPARGYSIKPTTRLGDTSNVSCADELVVSHNFHKSTFSLQL